MRMHLPPRDRQVLESWARSTPGAGGLAQRALIVLLVADGARTSEIVARTGASRQTVSGWKKRYAAEGLGGLQDRRKPGRPRRTDDAAIVLATLLPPPERLQVKNWSSRLLASELGVSNVKVAETWRQYGLEPWRREPFRFATSPRLEAKSRAVTGLYLNPPDHAVALCATDDRDPHAARTLLAALQASETTTVGTTTVGTTTLDTTTGPTPDHRQGRRHREFLRFLQLAAAGCPRAELHVLAVDNYASRRHPEVRAWLARHPRVTPYFTPTQRSWLTLTEVLAGLSAQASGTGTGETGLGSAIATVTDSWTRHSQPFAWTRPEAEACACPSECAGG